MTDTLLSFNSSPFQKTNKKCACILFTKISNLCLKIVSDTITVLSLSLWTSQARWKSKANILKILNPNPPWEEHFGQTSVSSVFTQWWLFLIWPIQPGRLSTVTHWKVWSGRIDYVSDDWQTRPERETLWTILFHSLPFSGARGSNRLPRRL